MKPFDWAIVVALLALLVQARRRARVTTRSLYLDPTDNTWKPIGDAPGLVVGG
jgi:hypothetical protein